MPPWLCASPGHFTGASWTCLGATPALYFVMACNFKNPGTRVTSDFHLWAIKRGGPSVSLACCLPTALYLSCFPPCGCGRLAHVFGSHLWLFFPPATPCSGHAPSSPWVVCEDGLCHPVLQCPPGCPPFSLWVVLDASLIPGGVVFAPPQTGLLSRILCSLSPSFLAPGWAVIASWDTFPPGLVCGPLFAFTSFLWCAGGQMCIWYPFGIPWAVFPLPPLP